MKSFAKLAVIELKLQLREPVGTFFTLVFPLMLLVLFGAIYGNEPEAFMGGFGQVDLSVPGYIGMIVGTIGMLGLPVTLATYRERGILRRFQATPLRPATLLWALVVVNVVLTLLGVALLGVAGRALYGLRAPAAPLVMVPAVLVGAFGFFAVGFVLAGLLPTPRTAQAVGMALFYPMLFLSGAAMPRQIMPAGIQRLAEFLPLTHVVKLLEDLWFAGTWNLTSLAVIGAMGVVALAISRRTFRWSV